MLGPLHVFFQCLFESRHPYFCLTSFTLHWANRLLTVTGGVVLNWLDQISQESVFFPSIDITDTSGAEGKLALAHICVPGSCSDKFQGLPERFNRSGLDLTSPWPNKVLTKKSGQIKMKQYSTFQGLKAIRGNFSLYVISLEGRNHDIDIQIRYSYIKYSSLSIIINFSIP